MPPRQIGQQLVNAVNSTGLAEVVRFTETKKQVSLLYRVKDKKRWLALMEYLLKKKTCWEAHICQQYFLKGDDLAYGWNFILQPTGILKDAVVEVCSLLDVGLTEAPKERVRGQLNSFPLVGVSPRRTASIVWDPRQPGPDRGGPSHKGAHTVR
jgi:hypothetical protein